MPIRKRFYIKNLGLPAHRKPDVMIKSIVGKIRKFLSDDDGPTAVEYVVMLMFVFLAFITAVQAVGRATGEKFDNSKQELIEAMDGGNGHGSDDGDDDDDDDD